MKDRNMTVKLSLGQVELLLSKKLCGNVGAVLSDRKELETSNGKGSILVFTKLYKRSVSVYGLTVVIKPVDGLCEVNWSASSGRNGIPVVGDLGAENAFCREVCSALEPYKI